jgi:hypothetical protein
LNSNFKSKNICDVIWMKTNCNLTLWFSSKGSRVIFLKKKLFENQWQCLLIIDTEGMGWVIASLGMRGEGGGGAAIVMRLRVALIYSLASHTLIYCFQSYYRVPPKNIYYFFHLNFTSTWYTILMLLFNFNH